MRGEQHVLLISRQCLELTKTKVIQCSQFGILSIKEEEGRQHLLLNIYLSLPGDIFYFSMTHLKS